ncbi:MAG: carboxypeptidase-like regulatory domain-containing protein, partial [Bacteroidales bacterium]|nr:carboxypeptidase-like regulatory domain-containing protein [Bacteroidales bacterium]
SDNHRNLAGKTSVYAIALYCAFMSFRTYVRNLYSSAFRFLPLVEMTEIYKTITIRLLSSSVNQKTLFPLKSGSLIFLLCLGVFLLSLGNKYVFAAENGILSGRIVDVAHNPVAGVEVFVYNHSNTRRPADYISPASNKDGEFRITLPPGSYWTVARLRLGKERFGPLLPGDKHSGAPLEVDIAPGENIEEEYVVADLEETSQLAVKFDTTFIRVEGALIDPKGLPVENAYAIANRNPAMKKIPDFISTWTDKDGGYTLFLSPGTYYFGYAFKFPPELKSMQLTKVIVDSETKNINIVTEE